MTLREIALQIADLVERKREAYGDSITSSEAALTLLYPGGIPVEDYGNVLLIARIWDKLQRLATGHPSSDGESPFADIAGYGICGVLQHHTHLQLQEMSRAWQGNANGPAAPPPSTEPAASAPPPTAGPTTPNDAKPSEPPHSSPPSNSSPRPDAAPAPIAQEPAEANPAVLVKQKPYLCPSCYRPGPHYGESLGSPFATCLDDWHWEAE